MTQNYAIIQFQLNNLSENIIGEIRELAFSDFECVGAQEANLSEGEVDQILGERAFCGGELPEDVIKDLDQVLDLGNILFYFINEKDAYDFKNEIKIKYQIESEIIINQNEDWNVNWKKHFRPIIIEPGLRVVPAFHLEKNSSDIIINPGMGFGTGSHQTTALCLKIFYELTKKNKLKENLNILDLGCGSGILGIAANKLLLNSKVNFVDIDKDALRNCTENILLNFQNQDLSALRIVARDRFQIENYDFIFANILLNILVQEKNIIKNCSRKGTQILFSGILINQVDELISEFKNILKFEILSQEFAGDWAALLIEVLE